MVKRTKRDFRNPVLGAAGGEGEGEGDLRGSVTTLLDAMQNLLGGLHLPELPNDGAASASDENDNEPFDWNLSELQINTLQRGTFSFILPQTYFSQDNYVTIIHSKETHSQVMNSTERKG